MFLAAGPTFINDIPAWIILEAKRLQRIKNFFHRLKRKEPTKIVQMQPPSQKVIVVPPEEICETPRPLQLFQARDHHIAHNFAQQLGLAILFHERDEHDSHDRTLVFWGLPADFLVKLLKCYKDMREAGEFTMQERMVVNDLVNKKWIRKLSEGGKTYYYRLHPDTAAMLGRQLARLTENSQPRQNQTVAV